MTTPGDGDDTNTPLLQEGQLQNTAREGKARGKSRSRDGKNSSTSDKEEKKSDKKKKKKRKKSSRTGNGSTSKSSQRSDINSSHAGTQRSSIYTYYDSEYDTQYSNSNAKSAKGTLLLNQGGDGGRHYAVGDRECQTPPSTMKPFLFALIAGLGAFQFGVTLGYTSPIKNQLQAAHPAGIGITQSQQDLFGSMANIGAMVGALLAGPLVDWISRTMTMFVAGLLFCGGFLMVAFCGDVHGSPYAVLMTGRVLSGLAVGMVSMAVPVYIAEIAPPRLRGGLGSINQLSITTGILVVYGLGTAVDWKQLAWISAIPAGVLCVAVFFIPKSPRWLCKKGRMPQAREMLVRIRGADYNSNGELQEMINSLQSEATNSSSVLDLFRGGARKALVIAIVLMLYQQFSGINAFILNAATIFEDAGMSNPDSSSIIFGAVQAAVTCISCVLVDKAGRRALLMVAGIGMTAALVLLGYFFWIKENGYEMSGLVALVTSFLYISAFSLGLGAVPWVLMAEMFSSELRGIASSFSACVNWSASFVVTESFHSMQTAMNASGVFWFYGAVCLAGVLFVLFFVPETKGRTLEQISGYFAGLPSPDQKVDGAGTGGALVKLGALLALLYLGIMLFIASI